MSHFVPEVYTIRIIRGLLPRLFQHFGEFLRKLPAAQVLRYDDAVGRDQEVRGDRRDPIGCGGRAPFVCVDAQDIDPRHVVGRRERPPFCLVVVERDGVNFKPLGFVCGVCLAQVGDLVAAGGAPRRPEVEQNPASRFHQRRERYGFALRLPARRVLLLQLSFQQ